MSEQRRLLTIAAHSADQELAAGMQIAKFTGAGHHATILSLTPGEKGHPRLSPEEYAPQKIREAGECAARLGAESIVLSYGDALLQPTQEIAFAVADIIRDVRPDTVITHWSRSIHNDHRHAHTIAMDALFFAALRTLGRSKPAHYVRHVYFSENWEDMDGFEPDVYLDTSDVFEQYRDALSAFELWHGGTGWPYGDYYSALARMRACLGGGLRWQYAAAMARPPEARVQCIDNLP